MEGKRLERSEVEEEFKWNINDVYKNIEAWEKDFNKIQGLLKKVTKYKGKIKESSKNLSEVLKANTALDRTLTNLYVYASLKFNENTLEEESMILKDKVEDLLSKVSEETSFIINEILTINQQEITKFIKEEKDLKEYKFYLERIFKLQKHILSESDEKMLARLDNLLEAPSTIYDTITDSDMKYGVVIIDGQEVEITHSNFVKYQKHPSQKVRKDVFEKYYDAYEKLKNTFASTYKYTIKKANNEAELRKYTSSLEMSLYPNDIDTSVYHTLIDEVNNNLDKMHEYIALRKKELGVKELHMYDIYADMVTNLNEEYPFTLAKDLVLEALKPLGEDYIKIVKKAFQDKWIDVYDNVGKRGGAYSWGTYDSNPYISLGYDSTLDSVSTLAHELGHSVHTYHSNKNNPYHYSGYSLFLAEIASTVNEMLLARYLLDNSKNKDIKKHVLNEQMERYKGTVYRQTMFAEFELKCHEMEQSGEGITENKLSSLYYDLNKKYYGEEIIHDELIKYEWMRIPHFYNPYYVYQYATGLSVATYIANEIYEKNEEVRKSYIKFLSSGSSTYPLDLLKVMNIDMQKPDIIRKALNYFEEVLKLYKSL